MGAVIVDKKGVLSWGWNHTKTFTAPSGGGTGIHAEVHAIMRANPKRLVGSTIYVAGVRKRNIKSVESKPCDKCMHWIRLSGITKIVYLDKGKWNETSNV
jgi:deoxycytidylate deaminase